jgi:hypothetical protein
VVLLLQDAARKYVTAYIQIYNFKSCYFNQENMIGANFCGAIEMIGTDPEWIRICCYFNQKNMILFFYERIRSVLRLFCLFQDNRDVNLIA